MAGWRMKVTPFMQTGNRGGGVLEKIISCGLGILQLVPIGSPHDQTVQCSQKRTPLAKKCGSLQYMTMFTI